MILFPPAKINLGLKVLFKREDGYHEIESCMLPIPVCDVLEILPSDHFEFRMSGLLIDGDPEQNLCIRAFRLLQKDFGITNVYMHLQKNIPMGAGLGGGSSDAAYVLKGLNTFFGLNISNEKLKDLAACLGSDCPFFIDEVPQIANGRGEVLEAVKVDLSSYFIKVVHPEIHVGTAEAYQGVHFSTPDPTIKEILALPINEWNDKLLNDFEKSIFTKYPEIKAIKDKMYAEGAIYASMSGSGSSVFGLYEKEPELSFEGMFERVEKM